MHQRPVVGGGRPRQPRREKVFRPTIRTDETTTCLRGTPRSIFNSNNNSAGGRPNGSGIISGLTIGLSGGGRRTSEGTGSSAVGGVVTPRAIIVKHRGGVDSSSNRQLHHGTVGTSLVRSQSRENNGAVKSASADREVSLASAGPSSLSGSPARSILVSCDALRINDIGHSDYGHGSAYWDDPLLSKLVSRALRDDDRDRRLSACRQLRDFAGNADNAAVLRKAGLGLIQELARVFFERTSREVKEELTQCCGLIAVNLGKDSHSYLVWLFRKYDNTGNEEVQILLLQMLLETMKSDEVTNKFEFPLIMTHARKVLENTDSQQLLVAIVDIVLVIVDKQPEAFQPHFHDTVDILIGWHIDPQQSESVIRYTSDALISFNRYWVADIQFSVTLLGQLLEDIEAYTENQNVTEESLVGEEDLPAKITSLIRVYSTIVRSLGDFYTDELSLTNSFVIESFSRLLACVLFACTTVASNNVFVAANNCVILLLSHVREDAVQQLDQLSSLIELQFKLESYMTAPHAVSLLKLVWKVVIEVNSLLPVDFLGLVMGDNSTIPSLRFMPSNEVQMQLLDLYRAIFRLKTVSLLEEAYRHVLADLHCSFAFLLKWNLDLVPPVKRIVFADENEAQTAVLFDLCAIAEVGSTKNSLIAMLAFNPSIFDLLTVRLKPTDLELGRSYPSIQYAIVLTIYSYCTKHSHFVNSSGLINASESAPSDDRPTASGHFSTILDLLGRLLFNSAYCCSVISLALKWSQSVIEGAHTYLGQICKDTHFVNLTHSLISSALNGDMETCLIAGDILFRILSESASNLGTSIWSRCFELCLIKMSDVNEKVREFYLRMFTLLPMGMLICNGFSSRRNQSVHRKGLGLESAQVSGLQTLWLARRRLQSRSPLGTFTVQDFRTVMAFVLQGTIPSADWVREMFALDQRTEKLSKPEDHSLCYLADSNEGILWFWATYEAALFCVLSKLRTPLGKAQDTFATIEVAVKNFASESIGQSIAESPFGEVSRLVKSVKADGDPYPSLLRGKLLLNFLEALEKLVYNSYEGCAVALAPPPKTVKTFFRTNKATCREWLTRIRKAVITLALHLGYPAYAVRQGYQLLSEMVRMGSSSSEQELRQVILMVVQALTVLRCPEPIFGLYVWAKETMGIKLTCVKASVDMAAGRYEEAAQQFACILDASATSKEKTDSRNDFKGSLDGSVAFFMRNQIIESFRRLGSWTELQEWLNAECPKLSSDRAAGFGQWRMDMSAEHIATLSSFDGLKENLENKWTAPLEGALQLWSLSPRKLQQNTEKSLISAFLLAKEETVDFNEEHCVTAAKQIAAILRLSSMESAFLISPEMAVLYHEAVTVNDGEHRHFLQSHVASVYSNRHFPNAEMADMASLVQLLRWVRCRNHVDVVQELKLVAARTARKHQNLRAARRLIDWNEDPNGAAEMPNFFDDMRPPFSSVSIRRCRESAKLLRCLGRTSEAVQILSSSVVSLLSHPPRQENSDFRTLTELNARSMLTLVKWFQADPSLFTSLMDDARDLSPSPSLNGFRSYGGFADILGYCQSAYEGASSLDTNGDVSETVLGKLLWMGTRHCPWLSKGWLELAAWCYKTGKKSVNRAAEVGVELTSEELLRLIEILPQDFCETDVNAVAQVLSQVHCISKGDELAACLGIEANDEESARRHALVLHPVLYSCSINTIDSLMSLWNSITSRVYTHYRMASEAYFTFLKLNSESDPDGLGNSSPGEDGNVMATLRLLRLMVKHASELRDVLEVGLANTPTSPWKGIIPQLFARLNHPEPYVRRSISDLLCRVTAAAPHLIVFPAVVGSSAVVVGEIKDSSGILGECLSQPTSYDELLNDRPVETEGEAFPDEVPSGEFTSTTTATEETRQKAAVMQNCFAAMVDTLAKRDPRSIAEVQKLVHELRRITLLWDEFWLGTLNQYHLDFSRRITQLEKEIAKVRANVSLTAEERTSLIAKKHETFLKPTLFVLEQLQQVTSQPPETPHEEWFQTTFSPLINDVIDKLKNPATPEHPQTNWQLYKQLLYSLQQRVQKRSNLVLNMSQISPMLATMKSTGIAMPGAPTLTNEIVTIESIDNIVSIMPTKTKPKKLVFYGSDGKKYPFLFKGLEDLHLDERIMQLLTIVNNMFARNRKKGRPQHHARHYSVTPLGPRSGLIQWVEGATPLFGLYKRWQQREAVAPVTRNSAVFGGMNAGAFLRPSEIFYSKLTPLLKEHGISNLENRKDWPLPVLRQVLLELMSETPSDLLARELWCASDSALDWWLMTENYAQSTAVMSIIGYIIGLGDRHLDNVLVDLETGEVVHIDYNVCFEKGKNLRVPEKVPFRMTPNIRTALGFTSVEGTFRLSCEHVLKTLRRGRETLLTLLDAFVYDPLIDWTPGSEGGYTGAVYGGWQGANVGTSRPNKEEMEKILVQNMFYIRMVEMKTEWLTNRDDLVAALPKLEALFQTWLRDQSMLQSCEEELQALHQEMAFMKEAEANPSHPLHTLHQRCVDYLIVKSRVETSRAAVQEKLADCNHWHRLHEYSLETVRGPDLPRWRLEVSRKQELGALTSPQVVEFLQAAGKGQLLQQCEQAEKDIVGLLMRQQVLLQASLDTLVTYATVITQAPLNYAEENRIFRWQNWLQELQLEFTLAKCQEIISNFHSLYGSEGGDVLTMHTVMSVDLQLQELIGDTSARMHKLCDRLRQENPDNPNLSSPALNGGVQECLSCVSHIAAEHGTVVVACVIASALSSLSYRLASLESTARSAGDQLANFTSRDGDWFLDEFYSVSSSVDELVSLAANVCDEVLNPPAHAAFKAVSAWHQVVTALQELYLNFRTIILPEALKCLLLGDPSVKNTFMQLESLVAEIGLPLTSLVQELELQVRHVVMKMEPPQSNACQLVQHLRSRFKPLIEVRLGSDEGSNLTSGKMLLMGFDGLFTKLETDFWQFRELSMPMLSAMPPSWRKVNVIKDARALLSPSFLDEVYHLLGGIFFVKQLQAMTNFFALSQRHCWSLRSAGNGGVGVHEYSVYVGDDQESLLAAAPTLYSEECLAKPILGFIAEFICKMVLGLPAQALGLSLCHLLECCGLDVGAEVDLRDVGAESKVALDDLCRKVVDLCLRNGSVQPAYLNQIGEFVTNLERLWRKHVLVRRLGQNVMIEKSVLQRAQLQLTYHQWIHEDLLVQGSVGGAPSLSSPTRSSIMTDMRKNMQGLLSMESGMSLVRERYLSLGNSVEQRLRWAAGANPSISTTLEDFEQSISSVNQLIVSLTKVSTEVASTCGSILHFEAFRSRTTEAMTSDSGFLQLINRCQESCLLLENCASVVTPLEEKLLQLKPLEKHAVIPDWIAAVTNRIASNVGDVQRRLSQSKGDLALTAEAVKSHVVAIRVLLGTHHRLMNEVRTILKSMAKYEEVQVNSAHAGLHQYVAAYRAYSEHITLLVKEALSEEFTVDKVGAFLVVIQGLKSGTAPIYDMLVTLGDQLGVANDSSEDVRRPKAAASTAVALGSAAQLSVEFPRAPIKVMQSASRLLTSNQRGMDLLSGASPSSQGVPAKITSVTSTLRKTPVVTRDPRTGKAVQERNSYAVSVWKRVKMKLDGRDPDGNKRLTIPEQVDYVISEATSLDNLASLYEGWTPWV